MAYEWVPKFLESLARTPNVTGACRLAKVSRKAAYDHRNADEAFAAAWDDALDQSVDDLVGDAWTRALGPDASDTLTIFLLKAHRPAVYRDVQTQQHTGAISVRVEYEDVEPKHDD